MKGVMVEIAVDVDTAFVETGRNGVRVGEGSRLAAALCCSGDTAQDVHETAVSKSKVVQEYKSMREIL
jgi:hypothetical protein